MPRTAATITQSNVARALRAAKQVGAGCVEVRPDGTIFVHIDRLASYPTEPTAPATKRKITL